MLKHEGKAFLPCAIGVVWIPSYLDNAARIPPVRERYRVPRYCEHSVLERGVLEWNVVL